jgi:hypothetical protein
MPMLKKSLNRLVCPNGHDLTGSNRRPTGVCKICARKSKGYKGNPVNREKTHCPKGHPYEGDNLGLVSRGKNKVRYCKTCRSARARAYYWNKVKQEKHPGSPGRPRKYDNESGQVLPATV